MYPVQIRQNVGQLAEYAKECASHGHLKNERSKLLLKLIQAFFREHILLGTYNNHRLTFTLTNTERVLYVEEVSLNTMEGFNSFGKIYLQEKSGQVSQIQSPLKFLKIVRTELAIEYSRGSWKNLYYEIRNHTRNALLSSYHQCYLNKKIIQEMETKKYTNFLQWLKNQNHLVEHLFLEQFSQAHPYYYCNKFKGGFSNKDVVNYSPEFHPEVAIQIAAIQKDFIHIETMENQADFITLFAENYPDVWQQWVQKVLEKNLNIDDYIPIPIHPWQAEKIVPEMFKDFIEKGILHLFNDVNILTTPTLSVRTVAPLNSNAPYLKLSLAIKGTSRMRTLSPEKTEHGPRMSQLLNKIFIEENNFGGCLDFIREPYSLHLKNVSEEQGQNLAIIFRENINHYLLPDETCVMVAALFAQSPASQLNLFIELMHSAGVTTLKEARSYFSHYLDVALNGYLDMYLLYGISFEGHQQNTFAVFRNGYLSRFIARDTGAERYIHLPTLQHRGYSIMSPPPSVSQDKTSTRDLLLYAVYQRHLGELVLSLAHHFNCDERDFWQEIKKITHKRFTLLKNRLDPETWQTEYDAIMKATWPHKAFLSMSLKKKLNNENLKFSVRMPNPLIDPSN